jgi:hypothetical protein
MKLLHGVILPPSESCFGSVNFVVDSEAVDSKKPMGFFQYGSAAGGSSAA